MCGPDKLSRDVQKLHSELRACPPAVDGSLGAMLVPGDPELEAAECTSRQEIPPQPSVVTDLRRIAGLFDVECAGLSEG